MRLYQSLSQFKRDQSGAVAIEFVLIAPLLFALLFGVMVVGYFMGVSHSVQQLATGAARASVAGLDTVERIELANAYLSQSNTNYPLLTQEAISPTVTMVETNPASITVNITYTIAGSVMDIANGFLAFGMTDIEGSAYLAY